MVKVLSSPLTRIAAVIAFVGASVGAFGPWARREVYHGTTVVLLDAIHTLQYWVAVLFHFQR